MTSERPAGRLSPEILASFFGAEAASAAAAGPEGTPVPYTLTPQAEALLDAGPDAGPWWAAALADPAHPGHEDAAAAAREAEIEAADEWDCFDSAAYQLRVEAGLEPEAEPW